MAECNSRHRIRQRTGFRVGGGIRQSYGLTAAIYSGDINVSIGSLLESVNVTFIVQNSGATNAISQPRPEASGCSASKLAITETGLANNFAVPAGWPSTLIVQLNNDCATSVTNGDVVASFSNGDAPLNLIGDTLGNYSATWQPGRINSNMVVTLNAMVGTLYRLSRSTVESHQSDAAAASRAN